MAVMDVLILASGIWSVVLTQFVLTDPCQVSLVVFVGRWQPTSSALVDRGVNPVISSGRPAPGSQAGRLVRRLARNSDHVRFQTSFRQVLLKYLA